MKVSSQTTTKLISKKPISNPKESASNELKPAVNVQIRKIDNLKVSKNNPSDPTVATKVLDGLNSGMIDFSQTQRDAIAKVLASRADTIDAKDQK